MSYTLVRLIEKSNIDTLDALWQGILFIVDWLLCIAFYTVQLVAQHRVPTIRRLDPGSTYQWRIVAHMLIVTTVQFCDPVVLFILMITNNRLLHRKPVTAVTS